MGHKPRDIPSTRCDHGDDAEDLIEEANILIKEISAPMWITGSIPTMLQAFASAGPKMQSLIPPEPQHDLSVLYHPAIASEGMITGTVDSYTELVTRLSRPPPPPVMIETASGMRAHVTGKMTSEERRARTEDFYNSAHGRRDKWSEWKYLFKKLHAWWIKDFGQKEKETCSVPTLSSTESAPDAGPQRDGSSPPQPASKTSTESGQVPSTSTSQAT